MSKALYREKEKFMNYHEREEMKQNAVNYFPLLSKP